MPDQIDEALKEQRRDELMRLQEQISLELMNQKIGRELQVLIDGYLPEEDVPELRPLPVPGFAVLPA